MSHSPLQNTNICCVFHLPLPSQKDQLLTLWFIAPVIMLTSKHTVYRSCKTVLSFNFGIFAMTTILKNACSVSFWGWLLLTFTRVRNCWGRAKYKHQGLSSEVLLPPLLGEPFRARQFSKEKNVWNTFWFSTVHYVTLPPVSLSKLLLFTLQFQFRRTSCPVALVILKRLLHLKIARYVGYSVQVWI